MIIILKTSGGDEYSITGKPKSPNKTLADITRVILMNSRHKKEISYLSYQYAICVSRQTDNRLCGDVPYFLWHVSMPYYKHINIWVV